jgi:hypothetical protein
MLILNQGDKYTATLDFQEVRTLQWALDAFEPRTRQTPTTNRRVKKLQRQFRDVCPMTTRRRR